MTTNTIGWTTRTDGIVVLTLDDPNQSVNTLNADHHASLTAAVERLETERRDITGVIVTSGKPTFFAGGNLRDLVTVDRSRTAEFTAWVRETNALLRRLETIGRPVVAAIGGSALGGGLELALACHHRVCVDDPSVRLGFPEVTFGLLPGGGGLVRSVRMLGVRRALDELLLRGPRITPAAALELALVDQLVTTREELLSAATDWVLAQDAEFDGQPWDRAGYRIPGGTPASPQLFTHLPTFPARLSKQLKGANYPAPHHILAAAVEGAQVDVDTAFSVERRYFVDLVTGQVAKNMIGGFFLDKQQASGVRGRLRGVEPWRASKVVVLGAGMMGAAIAYVCAKAGMEVVLKDVDRAAADRGKRYSERLVARTVERDETARARGDELLSRITATSDAAAAQGADLVIEAVFEDPSVKAAVYAEIEPFLADGALFGSNTSTLPITTLARHVSEPARFVGLHFFSPVDKMPLLEIVKGEHTSEDTVHRALDLARSIGMTPIVVRDSRGFFTSRVIAAFVNEGIGMLADGVPAPSVEQASAQAGYPVSVLQLADEINLKLVNRIGVLADEAGDPDMSNFRSSAAQQVLSRMLDIADRPGRLEDRGFYDYVDGKRTGLWPGLSDLFPPTPAPADVDIRELTERLLIVEALEAVKCYEEGVIESEADANVGSLVGIGFPGWTGGILRYVTTYPGGLPGFVARAEQLAASYGQRFSPPASLVERAERGGTFSDAIDEGTVRRV